MSTVFRLAQENIAPLWPQVAPLVELGLRGTATHEVEDVRRMLYAHTCQLWVQCDMPIVEAIVITEFAAYPRGVWLRAWIAAASPEGPGMDDSEFLSKLLAWAREHNCRGFEACGRHGWLRRIPAAKAEGLHMRLNFQ